MLKVARHMLKVLFRSKILFISIILSPVLLTLLFSFILGAEGSLKVALIDKDNGVMSDIIASELKGVAGVTLIDMEEDKYEEALVTHDAEIAIIIDENYTKDVLTNKENKIKVLGISENDMKPTLIALTQNHSKTLYSLAKVVDGDEAKFKDAYKSYKDNIPKVTLNKETKKPITIAASVGIVIYIIFLTGSISAKFIIKDREDGTRDRILLSGISEKSYYSGVLAVLFGMGITSSLIYIATCMVVGISFGMQSDFYIVIVMIFANLLSVAFNLLMATVISNSSTFMMASTTVLTPCAMLSGMFWPAEMMPEAIQNISNLVPLRWVTKSIETLIDGEAISVVIPYLIAVAAFSGVLFTISVVFTKLRLKAIK